MIALFDSGKINEQINHQHLAALVKKTNKKKTVFVQRELKKKTFY